MHIAHPSSNGRLNLKSHFGNILAFIIPCTMFIELNIIGRLFLSEVILLFLLPILILNRGKWVLASLPRKFILIALLWLFSQIITDIIRHTPFADWSRGWAKIIFFLLNFITLYLFLFNRKKRLLIFATGIAVGMLVKFYLSPSLYALEYPWKFGIGPAITLLFILSTQLKIAGKKPFLPLLLLGTAVMLNLWLGARSLGGLCFFSAAYMLYQHSMEESKTNDNPKNRKKSLIWMCLIGFLTVQAMSELYGYAASKGMLGDDAAQKYKQQSSGKYGVLLGGRVEFFASSMAIIDSPIIGHGSWAKDPKYTRILLEQLAKYNYEIEGEQQTSDLIPSHSHIFGAWVESGVMGAIFWIWVLLLPAKLLLSMQKCKSPFIILLAFTAFGLLWNIIFSPFGAESRVYLPYYIVLLMYGIHSVSSPSKIFIPQKMHLPYENFHCHHFL